MVNETLGSMAPMLLFLVVAYGAMYLFLIRPQQQQQKRRLKMLEALRKGDRIVTSGGLIGWVAAIKDRTVKLKLADRIEIELEKGAILRLDREEE